MNESNSTKKSLRATTKQSFSTNIVIIPHPTEELSLIKFQKKLITLLNNENTVYYAQKPLWLPFFSDDFTPTTKNELKLLSKKIKSVELKEVSKNNVDITATFTITTDTTKMESSLTLLYKYKGDDSITLPSDIELPFKKIKIFRLAISEDLNANTKAIKDFVWVKL